MGAQAWEVCGGVSAQEHPQGKRNLAAKIKDTTPQPEHHEEKVEKTLEGPLSEEKTRPAQARAEKRRSAEFCRFREEPQEEKPDASEPGEAVLR